jgi:hypothetical protein
MTLIIVCPHIYLIGGCVSFSKTRHMQVLAYPASADSFIKRYKPGHTALYGLIMAKARQNVISREADKIKQNN